MTTWRLSPVALLTALLAGCGMPEQIQGQKGHLLPEHVRIVALRPFGNKTSVAGLERKFMLRLTQTFIRDSRLSYVAQEEEADGVVAGEIVRYIKEPLSYDSNQVVQEYKLWVIINIRFIDKHGDKVLWEEPRLEQIVRYFHETRPDGSTEDEAREVLWERFAADIVKRTIQGFGSVTGASERKISVP